MGTALISNDAGAGPGTHRLPAGLGAPRSAGLRGGDKREWDVWRDEGTRKKESGRGERRERNGKRRRKKRGYKKRKW